MEMTEALVRLDYSQALADRYKKDFPHTLWRLDQRAKACDYYRRAARKGHVAALFHASACAGPESEAAKQLRELAAEGGHPVAQEMKGRQCLREKQGAECALAWLGRAAAQGRAGAMSLLGWTYSTGEFVPRDDQRAFAYTMNAAKLGDVAAQNNVGQMYETGRGAPANGGEAFTWYKRAAEAGLGSA